MNNKPPVETERAAVGAQTFEMPRDGFMCFHCGEVFKTFGGAQDHFGAEPFASAGCQIKFGEERGLEMALRKSEAEVASWRERARRAESEADGLASQVYGLEVQIQSYKPFRDCCSIQDVFNVYDSIEGRALAAEERLADHPPSAPLPEGVQTRKE